MIRNLILLLMTILFLSCKKNNGTALNNNEINATIFNTSGDTFKLEAKANNISFGRVPSFNLLQVVGEDHGALLELDFNPVTTTGTYPFLFTYYVNRISGTTPIYENNATWVADPGLMRITAVNGDHLEGNFSGVGKMGLGATDSAFINGTFKVDFKSP